ncbi:type III restriction enzyme [Geodermatophilus bullaregiensis]|uniref:BPTD_3080 family restriction endonuclease n=1 Tax=Geodermatophilus bullaregiensis TaxID=1564160 RepID=UPI00195C18C1|nr:DEAD/DEAH box helicase family protein [Geodermatophilus bullaregiensis]MBM7806200.1 type III restriction enzyme [Geodermatophilus bullaregiensis]
MVDRVIDNPILNSPYVEPGRHFRFDDDGITNEIVGKRRPSQYFMPVPQAQRRSGQLSLALDWTEDRLKTNDQVNLIRGKLDVWRKQRYAGATNTSKALLAHWTRPDRGRPLFFAQIEALETAIWLSEVAQKTDPAFGNELREHNGTFNDGLPRIAHKMATGSGKTLVMAMLIAWHACNKAANPMGPGSRSYSDAFLVVAPGITIRDRLRVLLPSDPENYYDAMDLVPPDLRAGIERARVAIVNFHQFGRKETGAGANAGKLAKEILNSGDGPSPFTETPDQMARRVCRDLANRSGGKTNIVVLNDEAHHCWQGPAVPDIHAQQEKLTGEEKREAAARASEAHQWLNGLKAVHAKYGIRRIYDLSATPFFLKGSGYGEGTLFPWVVSDFSLIDAIEAGVVKIPRLPVDDNAAPADMPTFRDLWVHIRDQLPKRGRRAEAVGEEPVLPDEVKAALHSLYSNYEQAFRDWEASDPAIAGATPPVFIVVCNNTAVSKRVFDYIAGWEKQLPGFNRPVVQSGGLPLFRNDDERGGWRDRPRTILVDSQQLESGEAMSPEFKRIAGREIEEFKAEYRTRFPGRDADALTDEDLLREVMNTVGKPGKLGENVRCVVSVSMLTEGWDANTVTHVLGVRAFGTQLLCEQVVGRALRRRSYAIDEDTGLFTAEYAEVYGVPFSFIATTGKSGRPTVVRPVVHVRALSERANLQITFPRVVGYRYDLPDPRLSAQFDDDSRLVLTVNDVPTETTVRGVVGEAEVHTLADLQAVRRQALVYELARTVLPRLRDEAGNDRFWRFRELVPIVRDWLDHWLECKDYTFAGMVMLDQKKADAAERIYQAIVRGTTASRGTPRLRPVYRSFDSVGSTAEVSFDTTRRTYETQPDRCHITHVTLHSGWEQTVAKAIEATPGVLSYCKNDRLGFSIPYTHEGVQHSYEPDFLVRVDATWGPTTLIVEVSGQGREDKHAKTAAARNLWCPAINNDGQYGHWRFAEIIDPNVALRQMTEIVQRVRTGELEETH